MSFLILDVDKSLATIGGHKGAEALSGVPPLPVNHGVDQIRDVFGKIFVAKETKIEHPLMSEPIMQLTYEANDTAKKLGLEGIVIDTISHLFRQDMRQLEAANKSGQMEMKDWGKLERMYNSFISKLCSLPMWVIVNSHITYDKDGATGNFYFLPQLKGSTKDFIAEYFDVVLYTKTSKDKKIYTWQTVADTTHFAKDRLGVLDEYIKQDFNELINLYKSKGVEYPKILVIGESGTGKTRALSTLQSKQLRKVA